MLICEYSTDNSNFRAYYTANSDSKLVIRKWTDINVTIFSGTKGADYCATVDDFMKQYTNQMPETVTYRKNKQTGYYDVYGHNKPISE
jgi:hypothetical protein